MKDVMLVKLLIVLYVGTPILLATVHSPLLCDLGGFWDVLVLVSSWPSILNIAQWLSSLSQWA